MTLSEVWVMSPAWVMRSTESGEPAGRLAEAAESHGGDSE